MPDSLPRWLSAYRRHERALDIGFWAVVMLSQVALNSLVTWIDLRRFHPGHPLLHPVALELSSTVVVAALIPAIVWWDARRPFRWAQWRSWIGWHLMGSLAFSLVHVAGMVLLRLATFDSYRLPDWATLFGYEYLKDVRSYGAILLAIVAWRFLLLRTQGEARVLDAPDAPAGEPPAPAPPRPERFLVRKLRKEFLVAATDIDSLQAQGNYVALRVNGHDYLLRATLGEFHDQLDPALFARVHRSWVVNRDRIAEIEPLESGDARLKLKDGTLVPCSRRYREALAA